MGNLQSIMEELIEECLKKYDKDHKNFYETHKEEMISKLLKAFGNPTSIKYTCTEDPQVSGTSRRVDAYADTGTNKYAVEVKLSLTTGASLGRGLSRKVKETLESLNISDRVILVIVIPESSLENARDQLRRHVMSILRGLFNIRLGQDDIVIRYQGLIENVESPLMTVRLKRHNREFLNALREFGIKEIALLPI
ncbi:hypothetical protein B7L70_11145 [Vulcanisaeta sp. EB80]|nr:hypothetical protein B7L70_11145 [Vulcanisaeta sp. EB80]